MLLIAIGAASFAYRGTVGASALPQLPMFLDWFAAGMLAAVIVVAAPRKSRTTSWLWSVAVAIAVASFWAADLGPTSPMGNGTGTAYGTMFAILFASIITAVSLTPHGWVASLLSIRPLILLGMVSYGVFLWHFPVIDALERYGYWSSSAYVNLLVVLLATVPLAAGSWLLIERRMLALKGTTRRGRTADPLPTRLAGVFDGGKLDLYPKSNVWP
jgi:peptidoglycan/LPS O-acetylase OafA/YrhL